MSKLALLNDRLRSNEWSANDENVLFMVRQFPTHLLATIDPSGWGDEQAFVAEDVCPTSHQAEVIAFDVILKWVKIDHWYAIQYSNQLT